MCCLRKAICLLVVMCLVSGCFVIPAAASDDPLAVKDFEKFGAVPEETQPQETAPEETQTQETAPEETQPAETTPEETQPQETAPEETLPREAVTETVMENFPHYFQTDYPNVRFGSGTVANNGCSITSLAMVATYMTGHRYLPDELARYFGGRAENNIARLEMGSEALELPYKKAENWLETYAALEDGKLAIVLVDNRTPFTQSQHFLVLTGLNASGVVK